MNAKARPPVMIIGMHRSGTSMLSRMLEELGLFAGHKKEPNNESTYFHKMNEWMLRQANASWDNPYNFNFINDSFKEKIIKVLEFHLRSFGRIEYLGLRNFMKYRDIRDLDFPWGWKDPRNTFTLEIWKEIFPCAKILHIYRNPIDVAESLRNRELRSQGEFTLTKKKKLKEIFLKGNVGYVSSLRIQSITEGMRLWEEYINKAFSFDKEFGNNMVHIRYETFLENPVEILQNVLEFLDLKVGRSEISQTVRNVDVNKKFAFIQNAELKELYNQIRDKDIIKKLGYHTIIQ